MAFLRALRFLLVGSLLAGTPGPAMAQPAPETLADGLEDPPAAAADAGPGLESLARFAQVYHLVKAAYVDTVDDAELIELAIAGMLAGLDDHSAWLDAETLTLLTDDTLGAYDGLGVEVLSGDGMIQVMSAMPDSPAERAGLRAGDFITHIDGERVVRGNLDGALRKLRGRPGTRISLMIQREGEDEPRELELMRARIRLSSVTASLVEPGLGHVQMAMVQAQTVPELGRRLRQLERDGGPLKGLVLDLRGNPGGALDAAVAIADLFLAEGRIVSMSGRMDGTRRSYEARPGSPWEKLPLAVLIDRGSASAAEIIAAALQDNGRAPVLGERSYGKGSVQNVFALDPGHAVRLTTARYYTPAGRSIQDQGVIPDPQIEAGDDEGGDDPVLARALALLRSGATGVQDPGVD
ncbi:MAG: S41 family peptidase [Xanthomonadales bacterium]|nr:S41 family peptidase [Xanthomonadales bacterium]